MIFGFNNNKCKHEVYSKEQVDTLLQELQLAIYPVGSIYMSVTNTNPSNLFGGEWVEWGAGKVPVGVDETQTEFAAVEQTGGEKTHTLTIEEMPSHHHAMSVTNGHGTREWGADFHYTGTAEFNSGASQYKGGSQPHNNLQPYITCYMFKRIS